MSQLSERLRTDLTAAMKAKDELRTATIRMALTALQAEAVAGSAARELTDDEVLGLLRRQTKQRREAAEAFDAAGRREQAARERAEEDVLGAYLPKPLSDAELDRLVADVLAAEGLSGVPAMGPAMKVVQAVVAGRADGGRVAVVVRRKLASGGRPH